MNKGFVKNTAWIIFGQIMQMLISFVISMITARYLGPANYGLLNYTASYLTFASSLCTLGLNNIVINELIRRKNFEGRIIGTSIGMRLISSLISSAAMVLMIALTNRWDTTMIWIAALQSVSLVFEALDLFNYWFQSRLMSKYVSLSRIAACLIASVYKVYILATSKDVFWFAFSSSFEMICYVVILTLAYRGCKGPALSFSAEEGKQLLMKSRHFIISGLMVAIYAQMDKIMIGKMIDQTSVGLYSTAVYLCGLWSFIPNAMIDSARPLITSQRSVNREKYRRRIVQLYSAVIWLGIAFGVFVLIAGEWIIGFLYGEAYLPASGALKIVSWYCIFAYLGVARNIWIVNENKYAYEKRIAFLGSITNLILNSLLIPIWGIEGAALATLLTQFVTNVVTQLCIADLRENGRFIVQGLFLQGFRRRNRL